MKNSKKIKNIIIKGRPGSGKSTLILKIKKLIENKEKKVGGIATPEIRKNGKRVGFKIIDIYKNIEGILSHINQKNGPRVGKYRVNLEDLNLIGVNAIRNAIEKYDIIIIDEIGKMELFSEDFQIAVQKAFDSEKYILCTMGLKLTHPFINKIKNRDDIKIILLTHENRDELFTEMSYSIAI